MSDYQYTVSLRGQESTVRMAQAVIPDVQVTVGTFGTIRVAGGVPGPPGADGASADSAVMIHIADTTPHPAYDDLPSMTLLFENGLV